MKLICAPVATVTHAAFRTLVDRFGGCDEYYSEMINAATFVNGCCAWRRGELSQERPEAHALTFDH